MLYHQMLKIKYQWIIFWVRKGHTVWHKEKGDSMLPLIASDQWVLFAYVDPKEVQVGDIVLAKVHKKWYCHLVTKAYSKNVQISDNHGHANGWTKRKNVFAKVIKIG